MYDSPPVELQKGILFYSLQHTVVFESRTLCLDNGAIDSQFRMVKVAGRFVTVEEHVMLLIDEIKQC